MRVSIRDMISSASMFWGFHVNFIKFPSHAVHVLYTPWQFTAFFDGWIQYVHHQTGFFRINVVSHCQTLLPGRHMMAGWWFFATPLKNDGRIVSWDHDSFPTFYGKSKSSHVPNHQPGYIHGPCGFTLHMHMMCYTSGYHLVIRMMNSYESRGPFSFIHRGTTGIADASRNPDLRWKLRNVMRRL